MALDLGNSRQSFVQNQQGSVDWVRLGTSTISGSISVFRRLAAADVHIGTLSTAHAIAGTFWLSRKGEHRVDEALSSLRSCSALGNAIHFGFGIEHPVRHLARTQNGYACLALLGSLAELTEDQEHTPMVLSELTDILEAPRDSRPSLRQWQSMLGCCRGIFAATMFSSFIGQFLRLAGLTPESIFKWTSQTVGDARDTATVIDAISKLSRKELVSIYLSGNATCAWLAAFGNYFLGLGVELRDRNGDILHQSFAEHGHVHLFVTFGVPTERQTLLNAKSYIVRDLSGIIRLRPSLSGGRLEWDSILSASFEGSGRVLLRARSLLEQILRSTSHVFEAVAMADPAIVAETDMRAGPNREFADLCKRWVGYHDDSRGPGYLKHARAVLPELADMNLDPNHASDANVQESFLNYIKAVDKIQRMCECAVCNKQPDTTKTTQFCLSLIADSVIILLWALSLVNFHRELRLSRVGVIMVYRMWERHRRNAGHDNRSKLCDLLRYLTMENLADIVRALFTGSESPKVKDLSRFGNNSLDYPSVYGSYGICVFLGMLVQLNPQPEQEKWLQVLAGTIRSESGVQYQSISDERNTTTDYPKSKFRFLENLTVPLGVMTDELKVELIAKETLTQLVISFRFTSRQGSISGIGPARLAQLIIQSVGRVSCFQNSQYREALDLDAVGKLEGIGFPEPDVQASHRNSVIVRQVGTDTLVRLVALWTSHIHEFNFENYVILRTGECLPCCIRQGMQDLRNPRTGRHTLSYIIT